MVKIKKRSRRQTTKHRVKVERKVREHKRKLKKTVKMNGKKGIKKDPGVPNIVPFKEEVIKEAEAVKQKREQEREKKRASRKKARESLHNQRRNLGEVMKDAKKSQAAYKEQQNLKEQAKDVSIRTENSRKAFYKEVMKVIDAADIVLEVLDARDPLGSRCLEVERIVQSAPGNKRLILLLNKIDLVPKDNVQSWLKYLRKELPVIAFKASMQQQRSHLAQCKVDFSIAKEDLIKSNQCLGADVLMKLLRNYCQNMKMAANVGIIGYPNTGKSSIINSLKRAKTCDVGAVPGITRAMQSVYLDKHIKLLDSPGIVFSRSASDVAVVLRNCVKLESLSDPSSYIEAILSRCQKSQLMLHYNLPDFKDTTEFLTFLAQRLGKLKKGGVPDINRAARTMLQDWNCGKLSYYTAPPEDTGEMPHHIGAKIVAEWSKDFNVDDIVGDEAKMLASLDNKNTSPLLVPSMGPLKVVIGGEVMDHQDGDETEDNEVYLSNDEEEDEQVDGMEDQEDVKLELRGLTLIAGRTGKVSSQVHTTQHRKNVIKARARGSPTKMQFERVGGLVTKKSRRTAEKKEKKKRKKADAVASRLSEALSSAFEGLGSESAFS